MPSTSTSSEPIVSVDRLNLVFHTNVHRPWTLREAFTQAVRRPVETLFRQSDRIHIAKDLSFEARAGEIIGIIGVNGSGKTSLCRCIAGMYAPAAGRITVRGQVRAIFDTAIGIQPELTGRENAELLSHLLFPGDPRRKALIEEAMNFSELGRFLDVPFKVYSNGMQARLCLSLISAKPSDVLILDEVFDGADTFFRTKISSRVKNMIRDSGTVFFVSHTPSQIREVCTRVLVLHAGQLVYDGPVDEGMTFYQALG